MLEGERQTSTHKASALHITLTWQVRVKVVKVYAQQSMSYHLPFCRNFGQLGEKSRLPYLTHSI